MITAALLTAVVVAVVVLGCLRIKRARARRWLEAMATQFSLRRLPTETDSELRERMRRTLSGAPRFTRNDVKELVQKTIWEHGYPRVGVVFSEPGPGHVRAQVDANIPSADLTAISNALAERLPMTLYVELRASGTDS